MIRSAIDYARSFAHTLASGRSRKLLLVHGNGLPKIGAVDRKAALQGAIDYLIRAQAVGNDRGMGSYHLVKGWGASYPETTGYAIPTLLQAGRWLQQQRPLDAAHAAAEWLLSIQRADGGWQGGRVGEERPSIVFNTAQVVRGLLAMHASSGADRYLQAAVRAGQWITSVQEDDGTWRTHNFLGTARVYDSYVDAPLLQLHALTGDARFAQAASKNLHWVIAQQAPNGWFDRCDNTIKHNDRPITHTLAYTMDGLLECAAHSNDPSLAQHAERAARPLLEHFLESGTLHARYAADWSGSEAMITTGCAQLAIVWSRLHNTTGDVRYREGALRMEDLLCAVQALSRLGPSEAHGALPGSFPLWGRYEKFAFPNWGTKYFADALLCAEGQLPDH